jgi:hypothetical protein
MPTSARRPRRSTPADPGARARPCSCNLPGRNLSAGMDEGRLAVTILIGEFDLNNNSNCNQRRSNKGGQVPFTHWLILFDQTNTPHQFRHGPVDLDSYAGVCHGQLRHAAHVLDLKNNPMQVKLKLLPLLFLVFLFQIKCQSRG